MLKVLCCALLGLVLAACVQLSPFEIDLDPHERDQTSRQLQRIEQLPAPSGAFRFAAISDSHSNFYALAGVIDAINSRDDVAFVTHLGDMTDLGLREEFRGTLDELERLDVPWVTVIGNHDTLSYGKTIYRSMFGPLNYTFDYGGFRFVAVNSNTREFPGEAVPDLDWLRQATQPEPELTGVIALSHQTLGRSAHIRVLADNGVLAALSGHTHRFAIDRVEGVLMGVAGTTKKDAWLLVNVDGVDIGIAECTKRNCTWREPPP